MSCRELKTTIGKHSVFARQWSAMQALDMQVKLLNTCGQYAIPFAEGEYDFDNVLQLMAGVEHTKLLPILKQFLSCANMDGERLDDTNFDKFFDGNLINVILLFAQVCELQYKEFFIQGRALLPKLKNK